jgi:hypothetical protein
MSLSNAERARKWRLANPEHKAYFKEAAMSWDKIPKDSRAYKVKASALWRRYRITPEQWQAAYNEQEGKCAICSRHQSELIRTLQTDHCHETNKFRGLLCAPCNKALGQFKDSAARLESAIKYLKRER